MGRDKQSLGQTVFKDINLSSICSYSAILQSSVNDFPERLQNSLMYMLFRQPNLSRQKVNVIPTARSSYIQQLQSLWSLPSFKIIILLEVFKGYYHIMSMVSILVI